MSHEPTLADIAESLSTWLFRVALLLFIWVLVEVAKDVRVEVKAIRSAVAAEVHDGNT